MESQLPPVVTVQNYLQSTETTTPAAVQAMDTSAQRELHMLKQYLWKHPNRAGRITLYSGPEGNAVSFSHLADGMPFEECAPHGTWEQQEKLLRISFNHEANLKEIEKHTFVRHDPNLDVWYMAGPHEGWNAKKFAFVQPWFDTTEYEQ